MSSQQNTQEKKAWCTPIVVVLTKCSESEEKILASCKPTRNRDGHDSHHSCDWGPELSCSRCNMPKLV